MQLEGHGDHIAILLNNAGGQDFPGSLERLIKFLLRESVHVPAEIKLLVNTHFVLTASAGYASITVIHASAVGCLLLPSNLTD
ncbi:hypothetical protein EC54115_22333 [Escherichia coli 541-15]|nr:hypothetical protein EC54115_22333 [Escherichia coli 541-15]